MIDQHADNMARHRYPQPPSLPGTLLDDRGPLTLEAGSTAHHWHLAVRRRPNKRLCPPSTTQYTTRICDSKYGTVLDAAFTGDGSIIARFSPAMAAHTGSRSLHWPWVELLRCTGPSLPQWRATTFFDGRPTCKPVLWTVGPFCMGGWCKTGLFVPNKACFRTSSSAGLGAHGTHHGPQYMTNCMPEVSKDQRPAQ